MTASWADVEQLLSDDLQRVDAEIETVRSRYRELQREREELRSALNLAQKRAGITDEGEPIDSDTIEEFKKLSVREAIRRLLILSKGPLTLDEIYSALKEVGRDDNPKTVRAILSAEKKDFRQISRGVWEAIVEPHDDEEGVQMIFAGEAVQDEPRRETMEEAIARLEREEKVK